MLEVQEFIIKNFLILSDTKLYSCEKINLKINKIIVSFSLHVLKRIIYDCLLSVLHDN